MSMEEVNYLRKGKTYEFVQGVDEKSNPFIIVYDNLDNSSREGIDSFGLFGGKISRDYSNVIRVSKSNNLWMGVNNIWMKKYAKTKNLEIVIE